VPYAMSSHGVTRLIVAAMTIWPEGLISSPDHNGLCVGGRGGCVLCR
jgi:hypothetical protein